MLHLPAGEQLRRVLKWMDETHVAQPTATRSELRMIPAIESPNARKRAGFPRFTFLTALRNISTSAGD